jgi:hypothetical protein
VKRLEPDARAAGVLRATRWRDVEPEVGFELSTFRLRVGCSASAWSAPDGSRLLRLDAQDRMARQAASWMARSPGWVGCLMAARGCAPGSPPTGLGVSAQRHRVARVKADVAACCGRSPSSEGHDQHQPKGRPGCRGRQADPVSSLSRKAQAKPMAVASATQRPPCSKASGNIVSANKARIPPAARARIALTQPGDRPASSA